MKNTTLIERAVGWVSGAQAGHFQTPGRHATYHLDQQTVGYGALMAQCKPPTPAQGVPNPPYKTVITTTTLCGKGATS